MIVLEILKIIGIVLACIVGLAIALILLVLLAPITYQFAGKGENSETFANGAVKWLFGLARVKVSYKDGKAPYQVAVAWKKLIEGVIGEDKTKELQAELEKEEVQADPELYEKLSKELEAEKEKKEQAKAEEQAAKEEKKQEKEEAKAAKKEEKKAEKEARKEESKKRSLQEKLQDLRDKWNEIRTKIERALKIVRAETTKRALKRVKTELLHILNHLKPRKLSGYVSFGLEDPATTAFLYGNLVSIAFALSKGKLCLNPEFQNKGISFDVQIKGRIFLGYMLLCIVRVILDKNVQRVIKVVRRYLNG